MLELSPNEILPFEKIFSFANLFSAWQEFKKGKTKKKDVAEFACDLIHNLSILENDLMSGQYKHAGYFHFKISDPKPRDIHKASVRDRVVHHAIYRALYPYFDNKFIYDSYSCRVGKGTHKAIYRFENFIQKVSRNDTQPCWVLKCDIKKFFASIDHDILKSILAKHIDVKETLWLLNQIIDSFQTCVRQDLTQSRGLPLGNLTSQLLVNIYMNEFDQFVKRELKIKYYIRYSDDFIVLSRDKKYLENTLEQMKYFLENNLKLTMHPDKVFIKTISSGMDFLGWVNFSKHRVLRTTTKKRAIRALLHNPKKAVQASYLGLLKHGNTNKLVSNIKN